jgi:two-component system, cell cycle sensor histidine kinase and response regulator CckA
MFFIVCTSTLLFFLIERLSGKIKQSTNALRESEERLHFLVKNSSDSLVIVNADGSQRYVSPGAERITGFPIAELEGRALDTLIHPDDMNDIRTAWNEAVEHPEKTVTVQYRHIHKTKDWVFSEAIAQSFLAEPAINGIIASVRDITERKQIENALRESEDKFRLMFNSSPDAVNIIRVDDDLYVDINEGFTRATGFTRDDVIGKTSLELNIWQDYIDREQLVKGLQEKGYVENLEAQFRRKDGSLVTGLMSTKVISLKGVSHIISITRDITGRRFRGRKRHDLHHPPAVNRQGLHKIPGRCRCTIAR